MRILDGRSIRRNEAADHNGKVAGWSARYIRGGRRGGIKEEEEEKGEALFCTWCVRYVCTCIFLLPFVREGARAGRIIFERGNGVIESYSVKAAVVSNAN